MPSSDVSITTANSSQETQGDPKLVEISSSLPVLIPSYIANTNPQLMSLFEHLTNYISKSGCSHEVQQQLDESISTCQEKKLKFNQVYVINEQLENILREQDKNGKKDCVGQTATTKSEDFKETDSDCYLNKGVYEVIGVVSESERASQILDLSYFNFNSISSSTSEASSTSLFGLTAEDIRTNGHLVHYPSFDDLQQVQQDLIPIIERRLKLMCEKLYNFYNPQTSSSSLQCSIKGSGKYDFAKASQLPALIEKDKRSLEDESTKFLREGFD